MNQLSKSFIVY